MALQLLSVKDILTAQRHLKRYRIGEKVVTVEWGGYPYEIERSRIKDAEAVLGWLRQMLEKNWTVSTEEISEFIVDMARSNAMDIWNI